MNLENLCPSCSSNEYTVFHEVSRLPVHVGVLWPTEESARNCPMGDVTLRYCAQCGFIGNSKYQPDLVDYSLTYDNALHFSDVFQKYEESLARRLIDSYDLRRKSVMEIGCGNGHFLGLLCELGVERGIGFDPSYDPMRVDPKAEGRVEFVKDYFSERHTSNLADFICCRHVLEHIPDPASFLSMISAMVADKPKTVLYFEVPNARLILDRLSIWDIMYEHCDYFTTESIGYLFESCGFEIMDLRESYDNQFVSIELRPAPDGGLKSDFSLTGLAKKVSAFGARFDDQRNEWQARLEKLKSRDACAVVWGAGGKAVSFLNMLSLTDHIEYVVDINPSKQGTFLAGSAQAIVKPGFLEGIVPDTVIVMNPIYVNEIQQDLQEIGLASQVITTN